MLYFILDLLHPSIDRRALPTCNEAANTFLTKKLSTLPSMMDSHPERYASWARLLTKDCADVPNPPAVSITTGRKWMSWRLYLSAYSAFLIRSLAAPRGTSAIVVYDFAHGCVTETSMAMVFSCIMKRPSALLASLLSTLGSILTGT